MKLAGSKTEERLRRAFARELSAHASYTYFAAAAREAGLEQVADVFTAIANNEAEHAEREFVFLGGSRGTREDLALSVQREHQEATELYPQAAQVAEEEGFAEIAHFFRRMAEVEKKHEHSLRLVLDTLDRGDALTGRTVSHSAIDMAEVMMPHHTNAGGFVHGGELMKLMDNAAAVVAVRHCRLPAVTAMAEEIHFRTRVHVGDLVSVHAKLTFAGRSSMEVQIQVEVENLLTAERGEALTAHFVMVALGPDGKPAKVPPLIVNTEREEELFRLGEARYKARKRRRSAPAAT